MKNKSTRGQVRTEGEWVGPTSRKPRHMVDVEAMIHALYLAHVARCGLGAEHRSQPSKES